jgi:hypothetical protein
MVPSLHPTERCFSFFITAIDLSLAESCRSLVLGSMGSLVPLESIFKFIKDNCFLSSLDQSLRVASSETVANFLSEMVASPQTSLVHLRFLEKWPVINQFDLISFSLKS